MKDLSSVKPTKKNDETASMIVNVGKRSKKTKKPNKSYKKPTNLDVEEPKKKSM